MDYRNIVLYYKVLRGIATEAGDEKRGHAKKRKDYRASSPLANNYISESLHKVEEEGYKAAGILPIALLPSSSLIKGEEKEKEKERGVEPYVLLGTEDRMWEISKKKQDASHYQSPLFLNILGGKREETDKDAAATGVREFIEESGFLLLSRFDELHRDMHNNQYTRVFWNVAGKYALFIYHIASPTPEWLLELPRKYDDLKEKPEHSDMAHLYWIPLKSLLDAFKTSDREIIVHSPDGQSLQVLRFLSDTMRQFAIRNYLQSAAAVNGTPPLSMLATTVTERTVSSPKPTTKEIV